MDTFLSAGAGADASPAARSGSAMDFVDARRAALFGRRGRGAERRTASTTIGVARARAMTGVGRARRRGNEMRTGKKRAAATSTPCLSRGALMVGPEPSIGGLPLGRAVEGARARRGRKLKLK